MFEFNFDAKDKDILLFGIYSIENKVNNKIYIGSTQKSFKQRFTQHRKLLRRGNHHSNYLQNSYLKYGESNFCFKILKVLDSVDNIFDVEQNFIDTMCPEYNTCKVAGSSLGYKHKPEVCRSRSLTQRKLNSSKDAGVFYVKSTGKWKVAIGLGNRSFNLGHFINYEDALLARKEAEKLFWSEKFEDLTVEKQNQYLQLHRNETKLLSLEVASTNSSGYKFVHFHKGRNNWQVNFHNGFLGRFSTLALALEARDNYVQLKLQELKTKKEEILK